MLEPEGLVEIKYRARDLIKNMNRLDAECKQLWAAISDPNATTAAKADLEQQLNKRHRQLLPVYHQVALYFADLHDTAVKMQERGVIQVGSYFAYCDARSVFLDFKNLMFILRRRLNFRT